MWDELDLEDLVGELSDFLLQSGFEQQYGDWQDDQLQALHDAILEALLRRGLLPDEDLQALLQDQQGLERLLDQLVARMQREGYLRAAEQQPFEDPTAGGGSGQPGPPVKFG